MHARNARYARTKRTVCTNERTVIVQIYWQIGKFIGKLDISLLDYYNKKNERKPNENEDFPICTTDERFFENFWNDHPWLKRFFRHLEIQYLSIISHFITTLVTQECSH